MALRVGEVPVLRERRRVPVLLHGGGRRAGGEEEDRGPRGVGDGALPQRQQHAGVLAEGGDYDVDGVACLFDVQFFQDDQSVQGVQDAQSLHNIRDAQYIQETQHFQDRKG